MNITTRDEAFTLGKKRYYTGETCSHGHMAERYVSTGGCTACLHRYRMSYASPKIDHELSPWTPTSRFQVPVGLSFEQQTHLEITLQSWVLVWAEQNGIAVTSHQKEMVNKNVAYRMDRLKKGVHS